MRIFTAEEVAAIRTLTAAEIGAVLDTYAECVDMDSEGCPVRDKDRLELEIMKAPFRIYSTVQFRGEPLKELTGIYPFKRADDGATLFVSVHLCENGHTCYQDTDPGSIVRWQAE